MQVVICSLLGAVETISVCTEQNLSAGNSKNLDVPAEWYPSLKQNCRHSQEVTQGHPELVHPLQVAGRWCV